MLKFNVQVVYKSTVDTNTWARWTAPTTTVLAKDRKDACIVAMSKISKTPDGTKFDHLDMKNVKNFWTFKFDSKINDIENGDVNPGNL